MTLDTAWMAGRYGGYVLTTYGSSLLALLWIGIHTHRRWRAELKLARRRARASADGHLRK
jgi:heme exporter protein D